jgi:hypothetical protein
MQKVKQISNIPPPHHIIYAFFLQDQNGYIQIFSRLIPTFATSFENDNDKNIVSNMTSSHSNFRFTSDDGEYPTEL